MLLVFAVDALLFCGQSAAWDDIEFFEKNIRPVLVEHCYQCHSADSKELMGELRLDLKSGWELGGESGTPAVVPGKPDESPLILAVRHASSASPMPPNKPQLSDRIIADLSEWIQRGAPDPRDGLATRDNAARWEAEFARRLDWWSLRPVAKVVPPSIVSQWPLDAVDQFVLGKLQEHHLQPAPDADALTLLRRLSFVLTGLPANQDLMKRFGTGFAHYPNGALELIVDELLNSPHFGERIARHWMDVIRYTDTYGYEWDNPAKGSWEYRDYLIRAFNSDVSFDQLIREQIAGDLLPAPRVNSHSGLCESLIGPMFYHMGEHRHGDNEVINGVREEMIDNKVDAFSKAFLAMTVACARCHDHKLDAISQKDYYALAGMFMTPRWTSRSLDAPQRNAATIEQLGQLRSLIHKRMAALWLQQAQEIAEGHVLRQAASKLDRNELSKSKIGDMEWLLYHLLPKPRSTDWRTSKMHSASAAHSSTKLTFLEDGSVLASGPIPDVDTYTVTFKTDPGSADQIRIQALTHDTLGNKGPGRTAHGNFVLSHVSLSVRPLIFAAEGVGQELVLGEPQQVVLASARADYEQPGYPIADALDPNPRNGWGVGLGGNIDRTAWFDFAQPITLQHGGEWTITIEQQFGSQHTLGRFQVTTGSKLSVSQAEMEGLASDAEISSAWQEMVTQWRATTQQRQMSNAKFNRLTDFASPELPQGFVIEGDGMRSGYTRGGEPLVALSGEWAVEQLLPRGYHTHALSSKLPGALRLPHQQDLPGTFLSMSLAGDEWSGYLRVSDNGFQTENVTFLKQKQPAWRTLGDIAPTNGIQRIAYEIATSDLNPNFPPRTGVATAGGVALPPQDDGFDKRSWFSVMGIVSHSESGEPLDELQRFESLFTGPTPTSAREAWGYIGTWLSHSLHRYSQSRFATGIGEASSRNEGLSGESQQVFTHHGDVDLLNWLLRRKLLRNRMDDDAELTKLVQRYREVEAFLEFARTCNSMDERALTPIDYALNVRGDINRRGDLVARGLPGFATVLDSDSSGKASVDSAGSGRLELAEFLTDSRHGLAARVYVNRVWQWVFGEALVRTSNDFGHLGEQPSHPALLDYLTSEFMADGWSTKRLIRRLVLSHTFRQSGVISAEASSVDPNNYWLHHYPTRRLEAEAIRDSLLAVSGRLDPVLYGRPINPHRQVEDAAKRLFSGPLDGKGRRSIYLEVSIMDRSRFLQSFNAPDPKLPTGRRDETNVPAQALVMLNDPLVLALSEYWSNRLLADDSYTVEDRIESIFLQALGRPPEDSEIARWRALLENLAGDKNVLDDREAWKHAAHIMFNLQEFMHYR